MLLPVSQNSQPLSSWRARGLRPKDPCTSLAANEFLIIANCQLLIANQMLAAAFDPSVSKFATAVRAGLTKPRQKELPSKLLCRIAT
jgi:hypothetical protein